MLKNTPSNYSVCQMRGERRGVESNIQNSQDSNLPLVVIAAAYHPEPGSSGRRREMAGYFFTTWFLRRNAALFYQTWSPSPWDDSIAPLSNGNK